MMYRIIKKFRDKYTGEIYVVGDEKNFTKKRAKEILEVGNFVEEIAKKQDKKEEK